MAARKKPEESPEPDPTVASFETSMARLLQIVEDLESGELTLEASLKRFEEGVVLARTSQAQLDSAEARVEELLGVDEEGRPTLKDFEVP